MARRVLFAPARRRGNRAQLSERSQNPRDAPTPPSPSHATVLANRSRRSSASSPCSHDSRRLARGRQRVDRGCWPRSYQTLADSLARLDQLMAAAEARLRELLGREIEATRSLAAENARTADSLRTGSLASCRPEERVALDAEVATAAAYARIAELAASGLDKAIAHHPAFVTARFAARA